MLYFPNRLDLFKRLPANSIGVEIGVLRGELATQILALPVAHLYLVDPWIRQAKEVYGDPPDGDQEQNYRDTIHNTQMTGQNRGRVTVFRELSTVAALRHMPPLDFVYIDANHSYANVMEDLLAWSRKIKPGGCLMGHDFTENDRAKELNFGVVRAVDDFCDNCGWEIEALTREEFASFCLKREA